MNILKKIYYKLIKKKILFEVPLYPKPGEVTINGNLYTDECLKNAIEEYDKKFISKGRAMGELRTVPRMLHKYSDMVVNFDNISYQILNIYKIYETEYCATIKTLNTKAGKKLNFMLNNEISHPNLSFKMRGAGTVTKNKDGVNVINDDFKIISFDACWEENE